METMTRISESELIDALNWRYATKKFDPEKKLSDQQRNTLLQVLTLSASSMGLQPYNFIHVKDAEIRKELKEVSSGQSQIVDASELIVFAAKTKIARDYVEQFARLEGELRNRSEEQINRKMDKTIQYVSKKSPDELFNWNCRQAYIAMGNLLTAAAVLGIDACPMEGIDPREYDRILQLEDVNLRSLAVVTLGFRSSSDSYADEPKFRFPEGQIIKTI
jgi:nitroreductase